MTCFLWHPGPVIMKEMRIAVKMLVSCFHGLSQNTNCHLISSGHQVAVFIHHHSWNGSLPRNLKWGQGHFRRSIPSFLICCLWGSGIAPPLIISLFLGIMSYFVVWQNLLFQPANLPHPNPQGPLRILCSVSFPWSPQVTLTLVPFCVLFGYPPTSR